MVHALSLALLCCMRACGGETPRRRAIEEERTKQDLSVVARFLLAPRILGTVLRSATVRPSVRQLVFACSYCRATLPWAKRAEAAALHSAVVRVRCAAAAETPAPLLLGLKLQCGCSLTQIAVVQRRPRGKELSVLLLKDRYSAHTLSVFVH